MIHINNDLKPAGLTKKLNRFWELSAAKIGLLEKHYDATKGSPVLL